MLYEGLLGVAAGAVGTAALNIATYADMAVRGRPESTVPSDVAGALAKKLGIQLNDADDPSGKTTQNRKSGLGALFGYVTGLGVGAAYGVVRPYMRDVPLMFAGTAVGLGAMAMSDVPATVLGVTNPAEWSSADWASDIGFHLVYGLATVIAYDAFTER